MDRSGHKSDPIATEAFAIAFLLRRAAGDGPGGLTPLQVNKLAYILHGWTLGLLDRPLFDNSERQIQAWRYGPVVVGIYQTLKPFGNSQVTIDKIKIRSNSREADASKHSEILSVNVGKLIQDNPESTGHLKWVYDIYSGFGGGELINLTHEAGGPWDQCRPRGLRELRLGRAQTHIPDKVIRPYYKEFLTQYIN